MVASFGEILVRVLYKSAQILPENGCGLKRLCNKGDKIKTAVRKYVAEELLLVPILTTILFYNALQVFYITYGLCRFAVEIISHEPCVSETFSRG